MAAKSACSGAPLNQIFTVIEYVQAISRSPRRIQLEDRHIRILLVEDDTIMCKSMELVLKAEGYSCDTVMVGEDGIAVGKLYEYDAILLDRVLPDIDGLQVLKQLRDADVRTPVLILSGVDEPDWRLQAFALGADDFLAKPFDKRELVARIEAIVRRANGTPAERRVTGKGHLTELSERTGPRF